MANQNFLLDIVAALNKARSKQQIKSDLKDLGNIYIPLIGKLDKSRTKAQIKQDLTNINGTVNLDTKVNRRKVVSEVQKATQEGQRQTNSRPIEMNFTINKRKLIDDIKILAQQNTRLFKDADMTSKYNTLLNNAQFATSSRDVSNLRLQLSAMRSELVASNLSGLTLGDTFKQTFKRATELFVGVGGAMAIIRQLRNAWTEALNLDKAMTNLLKVTDELSGRDAFPQYLDRCIQKSKELAVPVTSLIDGIAEFKRQGFDLNIAEELAEVSSVLENVGNMSTSDAIKTLISNLQAFDEIDNYTRDQYKERAYAIADKINHVSNNYSIDAEGLSNALRECSAVMAEANTSIDQSVALIASGNRTYQDPAYLGNSLKILALRLRGASTELKEMGEDTDDMAESTSKLRDKIIGLTNVTGKGGFDILEADGQTFKSVYDIMVGISEVYSKMSDVDQSALLELIAGKHRSAAIASVLQNMSEAQDIYTDSLQSTGSATVEFERYQESAEAAVMRFKNTMTETYNSVLSGDTVKGLANAGTSALQFANDLGLVESTLKGIIAITIIKGIATLTTAFQASAMQASNFGKALNAANNISSLTKGTTEYKNALNILRTTSVHLTEVQLKQVLATNTLSESQRISILKATGLNKAQAQAKLTQMGLTQSTKAQTTANVSATTSTFSLSAAVRGLGASLKAAFLSNPVGIALMAISATIGIVTSQISKYKQSVEEARNKAKEAADSANTLGDEVAELTNKYLRLSEAVKTDAGAKEELITTQAELLKKLGIEGEQIDILIEKYGSLSEAVKQVSIDSLKNIRLDLIAGLDVAKEELLKIGKDNYLGTKSIISVTGKEAVEAYKVLEQSGIVNSGTVGTGGGVLNLTGDNTIEGTLENYQKLEDALKALRDSEAFTMEQLADNPLFKAIYDRWKEMFEAVEGYKSSILNINENLAQEMMLSSLQGTELPDSKESFETFKQELIDTAIASQQFVGSQEDVKNAMDGYLSTLPEFAGYYSVPLEEEINKVNNLLGQSKNISFTDDQTKAIEHAQSVISGLQSAMEKLNSLDSGEALPSLELLNLIKEYNLDAEIAKSSTDGLRNELERVAETNLDGIIGTLEVMRDGGYLTEEQFKALSDLFKELTDDISNTKEKLLTIPEALNALQSSSTAIENLNKNIKENKTITGDMISDLMNKYPQLTDVLNDYLLGVASTADVINALQGVYDNDVRNYQLACLEKKAYDEDFYKSVFAKLPIWVKELASSYGVDLENFKNIAQAKAQVEETLIKKSGEAWAKYYSALNTAQQKSIPDHQDYAAVHEAAWEANQYEKAKNAILDAIADTSINVKSITTPTFSSSGSGSKSKKNSGSKDTKETINWIDRKLDILEKKLSKLKAKADSVFGWSKKNTIVDKEIKNLESQIKVYEKAQNSYKNKYSKIKLSDDIISKIKNGSMDITAYDSKTAKKIKDYQDLYDKEQDCVDKITELRGEIKDLNQEKLDNIKAEFDRVISNSKSRVDEAQAKIDLKISLGEVVTEADYDVLLKETKYQQAKYQKEINELTKKAESQWKKDQRKYKKDSSDYNNARKQYHDQLAVINNLNTELIKEKQNQQEINQSILEIPLRPLERQKELIEQQISALDKLKSKYSDMIGVVTYYVGKQVDALNKAKEAITKTYDGTDGMITSLKDQLEALQKQNEERQQAINLQKAQYELERARNQKTIRVLRNGIWDTEADLRKIREAEEAKDKAIYDNAVYNLQSQIKELESQRDNLLEGYDDEIKRLNEISDKWSQIIQDAEMLSKIDMFESTYGSLENIINGSDVAYDKIKSSVEQLQQSLDDFNKAKESLEDQIESIENYIKAWKNGEAEFTEIQDKITQVLNDHSAMNEDILLKSEETIAKYINDINGSTKELQKELDKSVDDTKEKLQSMDKPLDDLQIALDKVVQGYDRFVKLNSNLTSTIPLTVKEYARLTEATDDFNTSVDNLSNKVAQFIPEMKKLDTVSVALKQSFETTSDVMQSISTGAIEKITVALDKLFNMVYLLNNEFGVEGVKALTDYIAKLTSTQASVQQLDTLVKVFITTMKSLKTELNETQTAYKNLEIAMGLAMEKLNQISTSAASASSNFASLSANINSAANAYYAFADAQKVANSAGASLLNSGGSIGLVGSSFGAALGALSLNSSIKGDAHASGTKSAKEGVSLVGEEKPELVIHNSRGTFELVDQPSLINLDSGDTVLNGDETRNILSSRMSTLNPALLQTIQIPKFSPPRMDVPERANNQPSETRIHVDKLELPNIKTGNDAEDLIRELNNIDGLTTQLIYRKNI